MVSNDNTAGDFSLEKDDTSELILATIAAFGGAYLGMRLVKKITLRVETTGL